MTDNTQIPAWFFLHNAVSTLEDLRLSVEILCMTPEAERTPEQAEQLFVDSRCALAFEMLVHELTGVTDDEMAQEIYLSHLFQPSDG